MLLRRLDLAADLAALVGVGMQVDVVLAGYEIGDLRVGEDLPAAYRARQLAVERRDDAGIGAGIGRPMDMTRLYRAAEAGIFNIPGNPLGHGVEAHRRGAG